MDLHEFQKELAFLIRTGGPLGATSDPQLASYLTHVAESSGLRVMRGIICDWRLFILRQVCPLTSGALLVEGTLRDTIDGFIAYQGVEMLSQQLARCFLQWVSGRRGDIIGSLARFEAAIIAVHRGLKPSQPTIRWTRHPLDVIRAALELKPLPTGRSRDCYLTEVAREFPDGFAVYSIEDDSCPRVQQRRRHKSGNVRARRAGS